AGGVVPLTATVDGVRGSSVELTVEVSADGGATFRPATLMGMPGSVPDGGTPGRMQVTLTWYAAADLGIRAVGPAQLRFPAREDRRTARLSDADVGADPRFRGDGTRPVIDPRGGPEVDGMPLDGIDPLGRPSNGGTGFASYYLDDNDVHDSANHVGNGFPDRN